MTGKEALTLRQPGQALAAATVFAECCPEVHVTVN